MGVQRMIRTQEYKLIHYPVAKVVRLFNVKNDPLEMNDLASDPQYKPIMDELFERFKGLQKQVYDPLDVTSHYEAFFGK